MKKIFIFYLLFCFVVSFVAADSLMMVDELLNSQTDELFQEISGIRNFEDRFSYLDSIAVGLERDWERELILQNKILKEEDRAFAREKIDKSLKKLFVKSFFNDMSLSLDEDLIYDYIIGINAFDKVLFEESGELARITEEVLLSRDEKHNTLVNELNSRWDEKFSIAFEDLQNSILGSDSYIFDIFHEYKSEYNTAFLESLNNFAHQKKAEFLNLMRFDSQSMEFASNLESASSRLDSILSDAKNNLDLELEKIDFNLEKLNVDNSFASDDWLRDFDDLVRSGLKRWGDSEAEILKIKSDLNISARESLLKIDEVIGEAFERLDFYKSKWNEKLQNLYYEGVEFWNNYDSEVAKKLELSYEIFNKNQIESFTNSINSFDSLVNDYSLCLKNLSISEDSIEYYLTKSHSLLLSGLKGYEWKNNMDKFERRLLVTVDKDKDRISKWFEFYKFYLDKSRENLSSINKAYGLEFGDDNLVSLEDVNLALANDRVDFWTQQKEIANEVYNYYIDNSSDKERLNETQAIYEEKQRAFDDCKLAYENIVSSLEDVRNGYLDAQNDINELYESLPIKELEKAQKELSEFVLSLNIEDKVDALNFELEKLEEDLKFYLGNKDENNYTLLELEYLKLLKLERDTVESDRKEANKNLKERINNGSDSELSLNTLKNNLDIYNSFDFSDKDKFLQNLENLKILKGEEFYNSLKTEADIYFSTVNQNEKMRSFLVLNNFIRGEKDALGSSVEYKEMVLSHFDSKNFKKWTGCKDYTSFFDKNQKDSFENMLNSDITILTKLIEKIQGIEVSEGGTKTFLNYQFDFANLSSFEDVKVEEIMYLLQKKEKGEYIGDNFVGKNIVQFIGHFVGDYSVDNILSLLRIEKDHKIDVLNDFKKGLYDKDNYGNFNVSLQNTRKDSFLVANIAEFLENSDKYDSFYFNKERNKIRDLAKKVFQDAKAGQFSDLEKLQDAIKEVNGKIYKIGVLSEQELFNKAFKFLENSFKNSTDINWEDNYYYQIYLKSQKFNLDVDVDDVDYSDQVSKVKGYMSNIEILERDILSIRNNLNLLKNIDEDIVKEKITEKKRAIKDIEENYNYIIFQIEEKIDFNNSENGIVYRYNTLREQLLDIEEDLKVKEFDRNKAYAIYEYANSIYLGEYIGKEDITHPENFKIYCEKELENAKKEYARLSEIKTEKLKRSEEYKELLKNYENKFNEKLLIEDIEENVKSSVEKQIRIIEQREVEYENSLLSLIHYDSCSSLEDEFLKKAWEENSLKNSFGIDSKSFNSLDEFSNFLKNQDKFSSGMKEFSKEFSDYISKNKKIEGVDSLELLAFAYYKNFFEEDYDLNNFFPDNIEFLNFAKNYKTKLVDDNYLEIKYRDEVNRALEDDEFKNILDKFSIAVSSGLSGFDLKDIVSTRIKKDIIQKASKKWEELNKAEVATGVALGAATAGLIVATVLVSVFFPAGLIGLGALVPTVITGTATGVVGAVAGSAPIGFGVEKNRLETAVLDFVFNDVDNIKEVLGMEKPSLKSLHKDSEKILRERYKALNIGLTERNKKIEHLKEISSDISNMYFVVNVNGANYYYSVETLKEINITNSMTEVEAYECNFLRQNNLYIKNDKKYTKSKEFIDSLSMKTESLVFRNSEGLNKVLSNINVVKKSLEKEKKDLDSMLALDENGNVSLDKFLNNLGEFYKNISINKYDKTYDKIKFENKFRNSVTDYNKGSLLDILCNMKSSLLKEENVIREEILKNDEISKNIVYKDMISLYSRSKSNIDEKNDRAFLLLQKEKILRNYEMQIVRLLLEEKSRNLSKSFQGDILNNREFVNFKHNFWKNKFNKLKYVSGNKWNSAFALLNNEKEDLENSVLEEFRKRTDEIDDIYVTMVTKKRDWLVDAEKSINCNGLNAIEKECGLDSSVIAAKNSYNSFLKFSEYSGVRSEKYMKISENILNEFSNVKFNNFIDCPYDYVSRNFYNLSKFKNKIEARNGEDYNNLKEIAIYRGLMKIDESLNKVDNMILKFNIKISNELDQQLSNNRFFKEGDFYNRYTIVGQSVIEGAKTEIQRVRAYRYFNPDKFVFNRDDILSGEYIKESLDLALVDVKRYINGLFGEKREPSYQKRKVAWVETRMKTMEELFNSKIINLKAGSEFLLNGGKKYVDFGNGITKTYGNSLSPLAKVSKYQVLVEQEKSFLKYSGSFGEYVGYAPVFKPDARWINPLESFSIENENPFNYTWRMSLADNGEGKGEIGDIVGSLMVWNLKESKGLEEFKMPFYRLPIWDDDSSFFKAPSLKDVSDIAISIGTTAVGLPWLSFALNSVSSLYVTIGDSIYAENEKEVALKWLNFGSSIHNSLLSIGFSNINTSLSSLNPDKKFLKMFINSHEHIGSNLANALLNSASVEDDNLVWDSKKFTQSIFGEKILSGAITTTASGLVDIGLDRINLYDNSGIALNDNFQLGNLNASNRFVTKMMSAGLEYGLTDSVSFNLLSVGLDQDSLNTGVLELNLGKDFGNLKIGSSGYKLNPHNLYKVAEGFVEGAKVYNAKYFKDKNVFDSVNLMGYCKLECDFNGKTLRDYIDGKVDIVLGSGVTEDDEKYNGYFLDDKIFINKNLLSSSLEDRFKVASVISHEGTHYNGVNIEQDAHFNALQTYIYVNLMFGAKEDYDEKWKSSIWKQVFNEENLKENDVDKKQFWLYDEDTGTVEFDGRHSVYSKKDKKLIYKYNRKKLIDGEWKFIEEYDEDGNLILQRGGSYAESFGVLMGMIPELGDYDETYKNNANALLEAAGLVWDDTIDVIVNGKFIRKGAWVRKDGKDNVLVAEKDGKKQKVFVFSDGKRVSNDIEKYNFESPKIKSFNYYNKIMRKYESVKILKNAESHYFGSFNSKASSGVVQGNSFIATKSGILSGSGFKHIESIDENGNKQITNSYAIKDAKGNILQWESMPSYGANSNRVDELNIENVTPQNSRLKAMKIVVDKNGVKNFNYGGRTIDSIYGLTSTVPDPNLWSKDHPALLAGLYAAFVGVHNPYKPTEYDALRIGALEGINFEVKGNNLSSLSLKYARSFQTYKHLKGVYLKDGEWLEGPTNNINGHRSFRSPDVPVEWDGEIYIGGSKGCLLIYPGIDDNRERYNLYMGNYTSGTIGYVKVVRPEGFGDY